MGIEYRQPWRAKLDLGVHYKLTCDHTQELRILCIRALVTCHEGVGRSYQI